MRIVFMGTPAYSVVTMKALLAAGHELVGLFAQPDKPVGRKRILTPPATKVFAKEQGIPVFQPRTLRDGEALSVLQKLAPDVIVVVAYGKILPQEILDLPRYGCLNGHASLLPRHRGASPIQWSIVCGDRKTGVSIMKMDAGMDTGDVLRVAECEILPTDTGDSLFEKLSVISAREMVAALASLQDGTAVFTKQSEQGVSYAPILTKEMAHLDFHKTAAQMDCLVRGFYSWPIAFFFWEEKRIRVLSCRVLPDVSGVPGTVAKSDGRLVIACGENTALELLTVQPEGAKPMSATEFLRGHRLAVGSEVS